MKAIELFYLPVICNNYSAHYFLEEKFSAFNPVLRHVDFPSHAVEFGTSSTNIINTYLGQYSSYIHKDIYIRNVSF